VAHYLVIHTPKADEADSTLPPTKLADLAQNLGHESSQPRWITTWSPDLHDERVFSYWEARNADEILKAIEKYGFLDDMDAEAVNVRQWGPGEVLAVDPE